MKLNLTKVELSKRLPRELYSQVAKQTNTKIRSIVTRVLESRTRNNIVVCISDRMGVRVI